VNTFRWIGWTAAAAIALLTLAATQFVRQEELRSRPLLPLTFAHKDHRSVNCIQCHHNFVDSTGQGLCIACHKTDAKVAARIEPLFHTFCRDCHAAKHTAGEDAGPVRRCSDCHVPDDAP